MTPKTVSVTVGVTGHGLLTLDVHADRTVAELTRDIRELSVQRKTFTQLHDLAHHVLSQDEVNQTGMAALSDAFALLRQSAQAPAVEWPSSFLGTAAAPAVDLVELTRTHSQVGLPPCYTRALSSVSPQAPAAPVPPAWRVMLENASPDALLRYIAQLIADLAMALLRMTDSALSAMCTVLARLVAASAHGLNLLAFALMILAVCRRHGRRSEPDDHAVLPTCRYPTTWGVIADA